MEVQEAITYIWIITNRKEERRKGYVQLRTLDAIMEDIRAIERDTDGLLDEIMK